MVKNTSLVVTVLLAVTVGYSGTSSAMPDYTEMSSIPLDGRYLTRYLKRLRASSVAVHQLCRLGTA